jgi:hypothetical protein
LISCGVVWPEIGWLEPFFHDSAGQVAPLQLDRREGSFYLEGVDGTGGLSRHSGRVDISLMLWANPERGVMLEHRKFGGGIDIAWFSKGDLRFRLNWVWSKYGTPLSTGFFIPAERAWLAVKQFIQMDGALPDSIEWVDERELPADTFPPPEDWKRLKMSGSGAVDVS